MLALAHALRLIPSGDEQMHVQLPSISEQIYVYPPNEYEPYFDKVCLHPGADYHFLQAAMQNPLRTLDSEKATVYIIPCLQESKLRCNPDDDFNDEHPPKIAEMAKLERPRSILGTCFTKVMQSKTWKRTAGMHHIWINAHWSMNFFPLLGHPHLKSISVGRLENVNELWSHQCHRESYLGQREKCTIVVPWPSDVIFEGAVKTPNFEEWLGRRTTVSYKFGMRAYNKACGVDATPLRVASLKLARRLEKLHITHNISRGRVPIETYKNVLQDSHFCLTIRGDTPSSHAFFDALAAHCIPIIVSDSFGDVATPFVSSGVDLSQFTIQISEKQFITNDGIAEHIYKITQDRNGMLHLFQGLQKHRPMLLWGIDHSEVASKILDAAKECEVKDVKL